MLTDKLREMEEDLKHDLVKVIRTDLGRVGIGLFIMCLMFLPDLVENLQIVKYVSGFLIFVAVVTHVTRRLLFPYINLKYYAIRALADPVASAIVFFGVCLIISVSIWSAAGFFK